MKLVFQQIVRIGSWLSRFRHRCGYGVHSPFAFSFITEVVYEKSEYYAYSTIREWYKNKEIVHSVRLKDLFLIFRLSNFQKQTLCCVKGLHPDDAESRCLMAGSQRSKFVFDNNHTESTFDMIYVQDDWTGSYTALLNMLNVGGMLVLHDIASTPERRKAWRKLCVHPKAVVTFNLRDFGIVMHRPELQKNDYIVNYF